MAQDTTTLNGERTRSNVSLLTSVAYLAYIIVLIGTGLTALLGGAVLMLVKALVGVTLALPSELSGWPFQGLLISLIAIAVRGNVRGLRNREGHSFSSLFYSNLLIALVSLSIGMLGYVLAILSLAIIALTFLPGNRELWLSEFREDLKPRVKEIRYSLHLVRKSPLVVLGIIILTSVTVLCLSAPWIAPFGPEERIPADSKLPPGSPASILKNTRLDLAIVSNETVTSNPYQTISGFSMSYDMVRTEYPPVLSVSFNLKSGADAGLTTFALYNVSQEVYGALSDSERLNYRMLENSSTGRLRLSIQLSNQPMQYTWVITYSAPNKTTTWTTSEYIILYYNHWRPIHYWGTDDELGGDVFSRVLWAGITDLRISVTVVLVATTIGAIIGAVSGFYGGKIDELVMRVTDIFFAFPGLILAMAIVMVLKVRSFDNIALALMVTWWPVYARLVRGQVLVEREKLYVEAARSVGASDSRILLVHILPNTFQPLIVQATMDTGGVLLTAAGLAFIGFGPPAGFAEWGLMIAGGQSLMYTHPWIAFFPGMFILLTALSLNLIGDGIRDIFDPKLRRR
ncbi:MAG: ABC transporter permease [Candidatus Thorarchaeota archaeon]